MDIVEENEYLLTRNAKLEETLIYAKQLIFKLKRENLRLEEQIFISENVSQFIDDLNQNDLINKI